MSTFSVFLDIKHLLELTDSGPEYRSNDRSHFAAYLGGHRISFFASPDELRAVAAHFDALAADIEARTPAEVPA